MWVVNSEFTVLIPILDFRFIEKKASLEIPHSKNKSIYTKLCMSFIYFGLVMIWHLTSWLTRGCSLVEAPACPSGVTVAICLFDYHKFTESSWAHFYYCGHHDWITELLLLEKGGVLDWKSFGCVVNFRLEVWLVCDSSTILKQKKGKREKRFLSFQMGIIKYGTLSMFVPCPFTLGWIWTLNACTVQNLHCCASQFWILVSHGSQCPSLHLISHIHTRQSSFAFPVLPCASTQSYYFSFPIPE